MTDFLIGGGAWWVVPISLLLFGATFGLIPGLMLRLIVLLYPKDDQRRQELFAELYAPEMGRMTRFEWVFQQLETALREGLANRRAARRATRERVEEEFVDRLEHFSMYGSTEEVRAFLAASEPPWWMASKPKPFGRPNFMYRLFAVRSAKRVVPIWATKKVTDVLNRFERRDRNDMLLGREKALQVLLNITGDGEFLPPPPPPPARRQQSGQ
jgi:hypothetical protein